MRSNKVEIEFNHADHENYVCFAMLYDSEGDDELSDIGTSNSQSQV
jgi:hypothetical protein